MWSWVIFRPDKIWLFLICSHTAAYALWPQLKAIIHKIWTLFGRKRHPNQRYSRLVTWREAFHALPSVQTPKNLRLDLLKAQVRIFPTSYALFHSLGESWSSRKAPRSQRFMLKKGYQSPHKECKRWSGAKFAIKHLQLGRPNSITNQNSILGKAAMFQMSKGDLSIPRTFVSRGDVPLEGHTNLRKSRKRWKYRDERVEMKATMLWDLNCLFLTNLHVYI